LEHLTDALKRIPETVTALFGPYLSSERPGRGSHLTYRECRLQELTAGFAGVRRSLRKDLGWAKGQMREVADGLNKTFLAADGETRPDLSAAAAACLSLLSDAWKAPALRAKLEAQDGDGPKAPDAVGEWLRRAEDFSAVQVVAYLSQFFVQLRTLLGLLALGPLLLLFAVSSYPFHPQQLWLLSTGVFVLVVTGVVLWILGGMERDAVVSAVLRSDPEKINLRLPFFGNVVKYALPLLGVVVAASPDASDLLHSWLDPVLRVLR
jgi:hypothetical protein